MRKTTTLGMVAMTLAVNLLPMTTQAAGLNTNVQSYGGLNTITISGNCNIQDIQSQLKNAGINSNCADWVASINQQNCYNLGTQQSYNIDLSDILGEQYSNNTTNASNIEDAVKEATTQLNQQASNNEAKKETTTNTTTQESAANKETQAQNSGTTNKQTTTQNAAKPQTNETANTTNTTSKSYAQQVVDLVNVERAKEGLAALTVDENVAKAATVRAKEIQTNFAHTRPDGSGFVTALREQGVTYRGAGENIAWGQKTPQEVVTAWMNSAGHRANIMNPNYVHIGIGNLQNSAGTQYWVQIFTY